MSVFEPYAIGDTGLTVHIADLTEEEARAVFGDRFYETWLETQREARDKPRIYGTITSLDGQALTVDQEKR